MLAFSPSFSDGFAFVSLFTKDRNCRAFASLGTKHLNRSIPDLEEDALLLVIVAPEAPAHSLSIVSRSRAIAFSIVFSLDTSRNRTKSNRFCSCSSSSSFWICCRFVVSSPSTARASVVPVALSEDIALCRTIRRESTDKDEKGDFDGKRCCRRDPLCVVPMALTVRPRPRPRPCSRRRRPYSPSALLLLDDTAA